MYGRQDQSHNLAHLKLAILLFLGHPILTVYFKAWIVSVVMINCAHGKIINAIMCEVIIVIVLLPQYSMQQLY